MRPPTQFGNSHEEVAVDKYLTTKRSTELKISCRERPWLGASLDRIVVESTGEGGLEVKCPLSEVSFVKAVKLSTKYGKRKTCQNWISSIRRQFWREQNTGAPDCKSEEETNTV
ncbi:hypothetical protein Bbelb_083430 [Branchiostoma belcheri]|nr:hypothetical protein Bbelb_083430 [Branchiostoma belcheri]